MTSQMTWFPYFNWYFLFLTQGLESNRQTRDKYENFTLTMSHLMSFGPEQAHRGSLHKHELQSLTNALYYRFVWAHARTCHPSKGSTLTERVSISLISTSGSKTAFTIRTTTFLISLNLDNLILLTILCIGISNTNIFRKYEQIMFFFQRWTVGYRFLMRITSRWKFELKKIFSSFRRDFRQGLDTMFSI